MCSYGNNPGPPFGYQPTKSNCPGFAPVAPLGGTGESRRKTYPKTEALVQAILEEASTKHWVHDVTDSTINPNYHLEVTLSVREVREAAEELGLIDSDSAGEEEIF